MKHKFVAVAIGAATLVGAGVAPAQAAGFAAKESWTHGADGIAKFVSSATCEFMASHTKPMRIHPNESYEVNRDRLMKDRFVRDYMNNHVNKGAGRHANMVPDDVRQKLIDLGILGTLKRAADCKVISGSDQADAAYDQFKAEGDRAYGAVDLLGILGDIPSLLPAFSSSM